MKNDISRISGAFGLLRFLPFCQTEEKRFQVVDKLSRKILSKNLVIFSLSKVIDFGSKSHFFSREVTHSIRLTLIALLKRY